MSKPTIKGRLYLKGHLQHLHLGSSQAYGHEGNGLFMLEDDLDFIQAVHAATTNPISYPMHKDPQKQLDLVTKTADQIRKSSPTKEANHG